MNPYDFTIYLSGLCGITMVIGSIWLLRTGVIKLSEASKGPNGITVEVAKKIKVSSSYPAVALFIIGLCFVGLPMYSSKARNSVPLYIVGRLNIDTAKTVTMKIIPENVITFQPDDDGKLDQRFDVDFKVMTIEINAAGYDPQTRRVTLRIDNARNGQITLPEDLVFKRTSQPKPAAGQIAAIPADVNVPLSGTSKF